MRERFAPSAEMRPHGGGVVVIAAIALALLLLVLALYWRVPMMLWDHLDLVPIYESHLQGTLRIADIFRIHGGHLHAGAYVVLLVTTDLSHGATWLDVVASALFLFAYSAVVVMFAWRLEPDVGLPRRLLFVFLALYPGHLANLQWGWQVAVFICLAGAASAIALLTARSFTLLRGIAAVICASCAFASFAIGFAVFPVGAILLALRNGMAWPVRAAWCGAWGVLAVVAALALHRDGVARMDATTVLYALDFLGAGIARYATGAAPWLGAFALATGAAGAWALRAGGGGTAVGRLVPVRCGECVPDRCRPRQRLRRGTGIRNALREFLERVLGRLAGTAGAVPVRDAPLRDPGARSRRIGRRTRAFQRCAHDEKGSRRRCAGADHRGDDPRHLSGRAGGRARTDLLRTAAHRARKA